MSTMCLAVAAVIVLASVATAGADPSPLSS
jgi:hypothetical protein